MSFISFIENIKHKFVVSTLTKNFKELKENGFTTLRLDESMNFSFYTDDDIVDVDHSEIASRNKDFFYELVKEIDKTLGQHKEFEINGQKVIVWNL